MTFLTDCVNTNMRFRAADRKVLEAWGELPHLLRAGRAEVELSLAEPGRYAVYALDDAGRRVRPWPSRVEGGTLKFAPAVDESYAGLYWEVVRRP